MDFAFSIFNQLKLVKFGLLPQTAILPQFKG